MASFLTDLAKPFVEKLINGAIVESSYICCFTCIAKDFEEEKTRLEIERATFERRIEEATRKGEDIQPDALAWKDEVDQLIQEDTKKRKKCFFEFCPHCLWRYSSGKSLVKKKERITKLMETGKELTIGLPAHLPDIERCTTQHYVHLKSRESQYTELLVELKDDNNYIIGLHGMGGTGKTTLIKKVGKELKQSKQFTQVVITTVSFSPNIKKIQDDIAGPLGLNLDDCNDVDRPKKLWHRLTNGEKILLILDDVWGDVDFHEIGIPYSENHNGCKIIVTTRNRSVCNKLGCNKTIQLDLLSKEDAWIMFKKYADLNETSTKFFLDKGRKIANGCKNLPIAIAVIGSSLKGKQRQEEWDMALKFLKKEISKHNNDDDVLEIYKCVEFSYAQLNEQDKSLFLLCSVFREDEEIPTERLARLAIGGGHFGEDYANYEEARSRVVISKNKLLDSCLLLEADQKSVKMHDFARDAAQWIANNKIQTRKVNDKNQKVMLEREKNIKYLLCEGKPEEVFSCKFDGSKLEILIFIIDTAQDFCDKEIEVPYSIFENNTSLRVFHLHCDLNAITPLPQSMQQLKNIRSLIFTDCKLGDISVVGKLQSLEALDLDSCQINEMPNGITELEKFRVLKLIWCSVGENNPFEVIKRCSSLQELYFVGYFRSFHGEITFHKLLRFQVSDGPVESSLLKHVSIVRTEDVFLSETTLKYCMQEAEFLRLARIEGEWRNIIPDIIHMGQGMNELRTLDLRFISQLKFLIYTKHTHSPVSNVFSKLVRLRLRNMGNLEELCNGSLSADSFKSLEDLSIRNCKQLRSLSGIANQCNLKIVTLERCPMLISLFEVPTSHSLVLLEKLEVIRCENLEYLITDERKGQGSKMEIFDSNNSNPRFAKLEVLRVKDCPKLEIILPFISAHDLPTLKNIEVKRCDKLKYIFDQGVELGSLKDIELGDVPNLIDIFPECNRTMSLSINRSSPISISASKPTTQSDPIKCSILSWTNMYCCGNKLRSTTSTKIPLVYENQAQSNLMESNLNCLDINIWERAQCLSRQSKILCNVTKIELTNLSKIESIFVLSIAPKMLLETLSISDCDKLKHVIIDTIDTGDHDSMGENNFRNVFPKLKVLEVHNCVQLEYIFGDYINDDQNHTEKHLLLSSLELLGLFGLPSLVGICPKQYHTTLPLLKQFVIRGCSWNANIKPIGDLIPHHSISRSVNCTTMKELSGSIEDLLALEMFELNNSKVENIFCVNDEVNEQQVNLGLRNIMLQHLNLMVCPFVGPKNSFALLNLTTITIKGCEKLQIIFSASILRCLPQLDELYIKECEELKHILEDNLEDQNVSNSSSSATCFPNLKVLIVEYCNKLKYVFPVSICNELPLLKGLFIGNAKELEEIFKTSEGIEKVTIPNLILVAFCDLPSLSQAQEIQFQRAEYRIIENCDKLSLTSTSTGTESEIISDIFQDYTYYHELAEMLRHYKLGESFCAETEVDAASTDDLLTSPQIKIKQSSVAILQTNSETPRIEQSVDQPSPFEESVVPKQKELINEQSTTQQQSLGESHTIIKPSHGNNGIEISVEQGVSSTNSKAITSLGPTVTSEHNSSSQAPMNEQLIDKKCPLEEADATTTSSQKSINEQSAIQQQLLGESHTIIEPSQGNNVSTSEKIAAASLSSVSGTKNESSRELVSLKQKGVEISVEQGTTSTNSKEITPSNPIVNSKHNSSLQEYGNGQIAMQSCSISTKEPLAMEVVDHGGSQETNQIKNIGDTCQKVEDLGSSLLVRRELEQLVSDKHLNYETSSLLTDFLVKHPSVLLKNNLLTNRFKGYAYTCLADLLKFLQTHSVLDVLGSSHSEFIGLIQVVRNFPFNKDWLDGVEKRALFPDLQFSRDAMQKLLDSKKQVTKKVEEMRLKLYFANQHVEDIKHELTSYEADLESIIQQEKHVLETTAALSVPLAY